MKFLLLTLLLLSSLFANKVIYMNYEELPKRVVKGEIFSITLKTLSTIKDQNNVEYEFRNFYGLRVLNNLPQREYRGRYIFDTFYFLTTRSQAKTPDIEAYLQTDIEHERSSLMGKPLNVITLNPKKNFSNIIANNFELVEYKTTQFDNKHNIIVFVATASNSDIESIHFQDVFKQGIESSTTSYLESRITYFIVIDKRKENFSFSYFNLLKNDFEMINIPIIVDDDSVVAQSDLKPKDQSHDRLKAFIAMTIALMGTIFIVVRKKYIYLILILFPIGYTIYLSAPSKNICIKEGSDIHLLPVKNGTIFETTTSQYYLLQEGSVKDFVKVKLQNEKIGWVKNDDICSN
jgi:hypothetical protein